MQENVSFEDWLAVHVVDFMNRVQLFYSLVEENCTEESCPKMSGGQKYEYLWQDGIKYKVFFKKIIKNPFFSPKMNSEGTVPEIRFLGT